MQIASECTPGSEGNTELPDYYACVAEDIIRLCKPKPGDWLDIGCGPGPVSIALAKRSASSRFVLMDPDAGALARARDAVKQYGENIGSDSLKARQNPFRCLLNRLIWR